MPKYKYGELTPGNVWLSLLSVLSNVFGFQEVMDESNKADPKKKKNRVDESHENHRFGPLHHRYVLPSKSAPYMG